MVGAAAAGGRDERDVGGAGQVDARACQQPSSSCIHHRWGWPNVNLIDDARDICDGVDMEEGPEVRRLLHVDVTQKTLAERLSLGDVVGIILVISSTILEIIIVHH